MLTGRRPLVESALADAAVAHPGVTIRRGVAVTGLLTKRSAPAGDPNICGVRTESGEQLSADLVVDTSGRRSPLPRWLADVGARSPRETCEESGFVYYARHYRAPNGIMPVPLGPLLMPLGTISSVTLPADNGTWCVVIVAAAHDRALHGLHHADRWERTIRALPLVAHWLDGEAIEDRVRTIAKIEDRHRDFVIDGEPVATGVVAVGDAWACTNPSRGRGASIGILHGLALCQTLRDVSLDDPRQLALAFDQATAVEVEPWFARSRFDSRHRLAQIDAGVRGEPYEPCDRRWQLEQALGAAAAADPDCLRVFVRDAMLIEPLEDGLRADHLADRVLSLGADCRHRPIPAPDRGELVALASGAA